LASPGRTYSVDAVNRTLDILEIIARSERPVSLGAVVASSMLPKTSVFRHLATLEQRGYIERSGGLYRLGTQVFELASAVASRGNLREIALPLMRRLRDIGQETVNLAILRQSQIVYVEIVESPRLVRMSAAVGARDSAHSTALGKAILAFLPRTEVEQIVAAVGLVGVTPMTITTLSSLQDELAVTRYRGFARDEGENEPGARCIGAPIFGVHGQPIASLSISAPADRMSSADLSKLVPELLAATAAISTQLGCPTSRLPVPHTEN
jgi:DNA-binding IclR family transcriptional regulator